MYPYPLTTNLHEHIFNAPSIVATVFRTVIFLAMDVKEFLILLPTKVYIICNDLSTLIILLVHLQKSVIEVTHNSL